MLQTVHLFSLIMAVVAAVWATRTTRARNATPEARRAGMSTILIACAVIIGVAPQALLPEIEWLQTAGPVASIVWSVGALFVMRRWRTSNDSSAHVSAMRNRSQINFGATESTAA
jgi:hypothetical protein